jgi:hypothetical protein
VRHRPLQYAGPVYEELRNSHNIPPFENPCWKSYWLGLELLGVAIAVMPRQGHRFDDIGWAAEKQDEPLRF